MQTVLFEAPIALVAAAAVVMSPFGRTTLAEVRRDGLLPRHARHLVQVMLIVALLVVIAAALNAR